MSSGHAPGTVVAVSLSPMHGFSKQPQAAISLLAGLGVKGDAHCGATVQHLYLKRKRPGAPNRMQVHLLQSELFADVAAAGFSLSPGLLGENITTQGIDLLNLPLGTRLHLGASAVVELTGLRTPCKQIDGLQPGLMKAMVWRDDAQTKRVKAGVMSVVLHAGEVRAGDAISVELPEGSHVALLPI